MKKLVSVVLVLCLLQVSTGLAGVARGSARAISSDDVTVITLGDPITVVGPGVMVAGSTATIIAGGTYRVSGTLADGMLEVSTLAEVQVILDNASITHSDGPAVVVTNAAKVMVVLADGTSNTLVDGMTYTDAKGTLFSNDTLEISGNGALAVTAHYKHGIVSDDNLVIHSGNITIAAKTDGLHANDDITIHGGTLNITLANDGMESEGTLTIDGGVVTVAAADDGIMSATPLTINGGTIAVTTSVDGIDSKQSVLIGGGLIEVTASQSGVKAGIDVTINGGQLYVDSAVNAVRSDGTLNVNGGVLVALGGTGSGAGLVGKTIALNGGTVVATGGSNGTPADTSLQRVAVLRSVAVGSVLHIAQGAADVLTFEATKPYQSMIFTSPALLPGRTYAGYTGGSVSGGTQFHGLYTGATYSDGTLWVRFTTHAVVTYVGDTLVWYVHLPLMARNWDKSMTPVPTATPTLTATPAARATPTHTAVPTTMATPTAMPTHTATPAATATPSPTAIPTTTGTPTSTPASTATPTATEMPTMTPTPTVTATPYEVAAVITLGNPITVVGSGVVVSDTMAIIVAGGNYRVTGTLADGMINVDTTDHVELVLDGVSITHTTAPAIKVTNAAGLSLVLADGTTNTLIDGPIYYDDPTADGTLFNHSPTTLEISGNGALAVTSYRKHGIASDGSVVIHGGNLTIAAISDGIHATDHITIHGGTIQMIQVKNAETNDGVESEGELLVEGGVLTLDVLDDGLISQGLLTVNGGTIRVLAGVEGIESKSHLIINGGLIEITVSDDALNVPAAAGIIINGGQIYANGDGDAIDSNGILHINGGVLVAPGGRYPDGGLDSDFNPIMLNGGIVVTTGGEHSVPSSESAQRVVLMGEWPVGEVLRVERDGADVLTFAVRKHCRSLLFTSPALLPDRTYTVYTGGTPAGGTDFYGLYSGATYTGGSEWGTFNTEAVVTYVGVPTPEP